MKRNARVYILIAILVMLTSAFAAVRLATREEIPSGTLQIETSGRTIGIRFSDLELVNVSGTIVNGKGEETAIDAQGILLSELLSQHQISGFTEVTVEADDAYSAVITAEEAAVPEKVYLITLEDGGVKMVVFGDADSKRSVSNVVMIKAL